MTGIGLTLVQTLGPVAGVVLGFLGNSWNQSRSDSRSYKRETTRMVSEREFAFASERRNFELDVSLQLPEACRRQARATSKWILFDTNNARAEAFPTDQLFGPRLDDSEKQDEFKDSIEFMHLIARVLDDELREQLERYKQTTDAMCRKPPDFGILTRQQILAMLEHRFIDLGNETATVLELTGARIRELYRDPETR